MHGAATSLAFIIKDRSKGAALLVIMLPVLLVTIDNTILNFALPQIAAALNPSAAEQLWMIDAYSLVLAGLLVTMGSSGDRFGHRRMLCLGCAGFALVSVCIVFSQQAWHLIAGRALLGCFGAMILPATLALIRTAFEDREERRLAVAVWATCLTIGSALGPLLGGVLLQYFDWQSVFLVALPFLLPVLLLAPMITESPRQSGRSTDYLSIVLSLGAMTGVMLGLKHLATVGFDGRVLFWALSGVFLGVVFVRRQLRLEQPLLDLKLFASSAFSVSIVTNLVSLGLLIGFIFFATQLLQLVFGLSPLLASLILVPGQILAIIAGLAIVPVAQKIAPNKVITGCLLIAAAAFSVMALFAATALTVGLAFVLLNVSIAAITTVSNDLVLGAVPADRAGSASSVSETAYEVGVVLGTTLIGGGVAALYRLSLAIPEGVAEEVVAAAATLGGAHAVSQTQSSLVATRILEMADGAFREGVMMTSALMAGLIVLFALVTYRYLQVRSSPDPVENRHP
ncbi:MFS transporter, DHA2 family, multidrug resistance protein [Pseudomonas sp. NFACC23-1]|uniref:MFS transporter n=1 Tax=unclassified Pseudomonas TaxID=196821 RepID=UPI000889D907|nr:MULTISPECIES: MFS transporter [unclassified Pseudomonas]SDB63844.1 MFS transporter, DHA2 family, multidrug resistance protein [Pseudomonas sp. NFACC17-2]SEJ92607.1 MFS transporter, DHA2 family, multidrug resistance protein [Pseudomonas sp. NFACC23-1]SFW57100.1 MFS transporter, DHA2 family, multidrug resistance protein [Pseudomonas sp. NFACC16-2]